MKNHQNYLIFFETSQTVGKDLGRLGKSSEALKIMIFHGFHDF